MNTIIIKHKEDCQMSFGRKDASCPRCQELLKGAAPRSGWQKSYYENKARNERAFEKRLREHDCKTANCATVCTAFDW